VQYGAIIALIFDILGSISLTPELKPDSLIQISEKERLRVFSKRRGKMNEYFDLGFVLQVNPFGSIAFMLSWAL
jgi:hypothetical protein